MKATLYVLHYIHSTHNYDISFSSYTHKPIHMYLHHPDALDTEAFTDGVPPKKGREHHLTTYSDACWGSQIGNATPHCVAIPLFKCQRMSDAILYRMRGPIAWKAICQELTSLSSCEAKIRSTSKGGSITIAVLNLSVGFTLAVAPLANNSQATLVYKDNKAAVNWVNTTTIKNVRHLELRDNAVREWVQNDLIKVPHVAGKCNPSVISTK